MTEADQLELSYKRHKWGERLYGTKEQLQGLGVGLGLSFPGEEGAPKRKVRAIDPRGLPLVIERIFDVTPPQRYSADIEYPDREPHPLRSAGKYKPFAPGVRRRETEERDWYRGSAEALVACGMVPEGCFPGWPGMPKTRVRISSDGSIRPDAAPVPEDLCRGSKTVQRASTKGVYQVIVRLPDVERERRREANSRILGEWIERLRLLAAPPSLCAPDRASEARRRRSQMRLAWSKPPFVPTITLPGPKPR